MRRSFAAAALTFLGGLTAATPATYLAALSLASAKKPAEAEGIDPALRLAVLVPAHDEEVLIGRSVDSLLDQDYPRELRRVVVVADNCTDSTARVARSHGAEVLERVDLDRRGKGHALNWAMRTLIASDAGIDAFVVVDADSVTDPGLLRALEAAAQAGAQALVPELVDLLARR